MNGGDPTELRSRSADAPGVDATLTLWRATESALAPIIGRRGFAALYQRSVHMCAPRFPWLAECADEHDGAMNLDQLRLVLESQSSVGAASASVALHDCFRELLTSLVGKSLSTRLLSVAGTDVASTPLPRDSDR